MENQDLKEAISTAAEQLANSQNFVIVTVKGKEIVTTSFINDAGCALGILGRLKVLESSILFPKVPSPQPSGIIKP